MTFQRKSQNFGGRLKYISVAHIFDHKTIFVRYFMKFARLVKVFRCHTLLDKYDSNPIGNIYNINLGSPDL